MTDGLALSIGAAVALGVSSVIAAVASRRVGTLVATAATLVLALVPLLALALVQGVSLPPPARPTLLLVGAGTLVAFAYLATIESLRLGPVSVTSPIGSAGGATTVAAAFVLLGERPTLGQWAGVVLAALGVVLASLTRTGDGVRLAGLGPVYAVVGVVFGSVANAIVRDPVRDLGPLQAIVTQRIATVAVVAVLVAGAACLTMTMRRSLVATAARARRPINRRLLALLLALGLVDALAFLAFGYALVDTPAWLVGVVSQSGRALAVVGGIVLFRERPSGIQWAGIAGLGAGLVVLAAFSS